MVRTNVVQAKSYEFALGVIDLARGLRGNKEFILSQQVLKSGTSIGANVEEALAGVSRADFVAKMGIASKEARETHYWLRLLRDSNTTSPDKIDPLLIKAEELLRLLTAIVKTTQQTRNPHPQN